MNMRLLYVLKMKEKALILIFVLTVNLIKQMKKKKAFRQLLKNVYCCKIKTKLTLGH